MPFANPESLKKFHEDPTLENISNLFTVDLIVRYIQSKLA